MNRQRILFIWLSVLMSCIANPTSATTWVVPSEVPTIPQAMDSALVGDTVLVAPGTYFLQQLHVANGVVLTSTNGPLQTTITVDWLPPTLGALYCVGLSAYTEISGFHIWGYTEGIIVDECSTIWISHCADVCVKNNIIETSHWGVLVDETLKTGFDKATITNNTFYNYPLNGPPSAGGRGLEIRTPSSGFRLVDVHNNIIWERAAISDFLDHTLGTITCNDFRIVADIPSLATGNLSADPMFCTEATGTSQFGLKDLSPCAPAFSGGCELIGAVPVQCSVPIKNTSWGAVKSKYRAE